MPAVSVIVPVFKVEPYMARCARSLFAQTLDDVEYIFIDDCSPDDSMKVMESILREEFPSRIPQVKCIRMPRNSGQAKVRMLGISLATGDYVIHCDSDDEVDISAYETMYRTAVDNNFDIVSCDILTGNEGAWRVKSCSSLPGRELADILNGDVMGSLWSRMVKRTLLEDLVSPAGNLAEDMVIVIQAVSRAKSFAHIDRPLYHYFVRDGSATQAAGYESALYKYESMFANVNLSLELLNGQDIGLADIVLFKYRSRHFLEPYVHLPDIYCKWKSTFPEVDRQLFSTRGIPFSVKFWNILIRLHLFHPWKCVTGFFRNIRSKRK